MKPDLVAGSPLWQTVFVSIAVLILLLQILRGWRLGLPRQLVRLVALVVAYSAALFGGRMLVPLLRPLIQVPDLVIAALGGVILASIIYAVINTIGAILFKRTGQQGSSIVRWVYGMTGAFLGLFFGLFFVWLMIAGIRSLGAVAEAEVNASAPPKIAPMRERKFAASPRAIRSRVPDQNSLVYSLARLKKSIELGGLGEVVRQTDVLPGGIYETLGKMGQVFSNPEQANRFLSYPGVTELTNEPSLLALRADPEIDRMVEEGRLWDLIQDERLIEAMNDPELAKRLKNFDLKKALDYAAHTPEDTK